MKVKITCNRHQYMYGDIVDMPDGRAKAWIDAGMAVKYVEPKPAKKPAPKKKKAAKK